MLFRKKICARVSARCGNKLNDKLIPLSKIANRRYYNEVNIFDIQLWF